MVHEWFAFGDTSPSSYVRFDVVVPDGQKTRLVMPAKNGNTWLGRTDPMNLRRWRWIPCGVFEGILVSL